MPNVSLKKVCQVTAFFLMSCMLRVLTCLKYYSSVFNWKAVVAHTVGVCWLFFYKTTFRSNNIQ
jgi:hypothetical protein